jgi:hypothetical protein
MVLAGQRHIRSTDVARAHHDRPDPLQSPGSGTWPPNLSTEGHRATALAVSWVTEWPAEINSPPSARPLLDKLAATLSALLGEPDPRLRLDAAIRLPEIEIERARLLAGEPDGAVDRSGFHFNVRPNDSDE